MASQHNASPKKDLVTRAHFATGTSRMESALEVLGAQRVNKSQVNAQLPSSPDLAFANSMPQHSHMLSREKKASKPSKPKHWAHLLKSLRPSHRKRRSALEVDTIMRREIDHPINDLVTDKKTWWVAMEAQDGREHEMLSLQDALDRVLPPEEDEDKEKLEPIPTFLVEPEKPIVRAVPQSELRLCAPGFL
ncbi:hypothetical protein ACEQ8H_002913 [Pleosporales sp. CAS-2024a]